MCVDLGFADEVPVQCLEVLLLPSMLEFISTLY